MGIDAWVGIPVPRGTPDDITQRMNKALIDAAQPPQTGRNLGDTGNLIVAPLWLADLARAHPAGIARGQAIAKSVNRQPPR